VIGVHKIDALIVFRSSIGVGTMEYDIFRAKADARTIEHHGEARTLPFSDAAPALDAVVTGDLGS